MSTVISDTERQHILLQQVSSYLKQGYEVQSQTEFSAILVKKPKSVNHILHLLLSVVTAGFWLIVWIFLIVVSNPKSNTLILSVGQYGDVTKN